MNSERLLLIFAQLVLNAGIFLQVIYACSDPKPPENMVLDRFKSGKLSAAKQFSIGDDAYFKCKDGFVMRGVWWTLAKKCKGNNTWVWNNLHRRRAHCIKSSEICTNNTFTCRNGQVIACSKRCDCNRDCSDGSDEGSRANCGPYIMVNATGKRSGTLKSPGYPRGYPGQLRCTYKIFTEDAKARVSLDFNTFDLRPSRSGKDPLTKLPSEYCDDYIKLRNNKYSSMYKIKCGLFDIGSCSAWCGGTSPPESESKSNFILLEFHTTTSTREHKGFSAFWTNEGFIPPPKWGNGNERPTDVFAHTRRIDPDPNPMTNDGQDRSGDGDGHHYRDGSGSRGRHKDNQKSNNDTSGITIGVTVAVSVAIVVLAAVFVYWRRRQYGTFHVPLYNVV